MEADEILLERLEKLLRNGVGSKKALIERLKLTPDEFQDLMDTDPRFYNSVSRAELPETPADIVRRGHSVSQITDLDEDVIREILLNDISDVFMAVKVLAAYGLHPQDICRTLGKTTEWLQTGDVAKAIEEGRVQGIAYAASKLFNRVKMGNFHAIQFYLKAMAGSTWGDNPDTGDAPASTTLAKEIIEMSAFAKRPGRQANGS